MYPRDGTDPRGPALPSLNALFVFEAAARHGSFTRAAAELGITQTAVSHQVKTLEAELSTTLFRRTPRRVTLTPQGQAWAAELRGIFARLRDVNARLRQASRSERPVVAVSIIPSFASRWLVPRLGRFLDRNPDVDVRISASEHLVDFSIEPIDVGIRYGLGRYPGLVTEKILDDTWVVICAPSLLEKNALRDPSDLKRETLLYDDHPRAWEAWFEAAKRPFPASARKNQLTDSSMIVEAAVRGQGVALARWSLAADEIALGRVIRLFPEVAPLRTGLGYYLVGLRESFRRPQVAAFRDWVRAESRSLRVGG